MGERVVNIKLQADATGIVSGTAAARAAVGDLRDEVQSSAMSQRQAWSTIGTGLTAVGVAVTGVGVAALKTGIQYNTLQQTSRAALTSILGSARAANAQMDALDDFARNSPFAKDVFIRAQQQMLGFGIETQKVIPYLDAIQNAVAASGGSNHDIAELSRIFSQISASSKITATDLREFGNRGIDAATLIGSQMGKTGAQIREEITAGTLDANNALDALANGMTERYEGAADGVKNTFAGAMDRVKAAWRDFSSELATPLVDPNGGGALVDLLNWAADAMRAFEDLPGPVKTTVTALTGLVGVGSLAAGAAMLALPKWLEFRHALSTVGITSSTAKAGLRGVVQFLGGPWGIALAAAAATIAVFNKSMGESKVSSGQFETAIKQGIGALDEMRASAEQNEQGLVKLFVDVGSQVDELPALLDKAADSGRGFFSSLSFNEQAMLDNLAEFGTALSSIATTDLPRAQEEFARFADAAGLSGPQLQTALNEMPAFKDALLDAAMASGLATDDATLLALALGEIEATQPTNELERLAGVAEDTTQAVSDLADQILDFGSANMDAEKASLKFEEQLAALNEQLASGATGLDKTTEAGRANRQSLLDIADAAGQSASAILNAGGSQDEASAALSRGRDALINAATQYGMTRGEAEAYADQILATPETLTTWFEENAAEAQANAQQLQGAYAQTPASKNTTFFENAHLARGPVLQYQGTLAQTPGSKNTRITADTSQASSAVSEITSAFLAIPTFIQTTIETKRREVSGKAYGGTIGYAYGGTIGAAYGLTIPGVGGGVAGGTVYGQGGTKSDSILVALSRGEEVIQEPYASMYRRELKAMNRGDFQPSTGQPQVIMAPQRGETNLTVKITGHRGQDVDAIADRVVRKLEGVL